MSTCRRFSSGTFIVRAFASLRNFELKKSLASRTKGSRWLTWRAKIRLDPTLRPAVLLLRPQNAETPNRGEPRRVNAPSNRSTEISQRNVRTEVGIRGGDAFSVGFHGIFIRHTYSRDTYSTLKTGLHRVPDYREGNIAFVDVASLFHGVTVIMIIATRSNTCIGYEAYEPRLICMYTVEL